MFAFVGQSKEVELAGNACPIGAMFDLLLDFALEA
jgi:hypothetical protein